MLLVEQHDLRNRIMHVDWGKVEGSAVQSAKSELQSAITSKELPLKCKNCTLEEVALLRFVQNNPTATQKEIAVEIGKSEITVKTITINLQEKELLRRVNGKRNGHWEIIDE
ncbi:MAG: winged helix-turn-helix transcriptional regulator [Bacteroidales bacterium]|nr:winged helix-turn-helix transcriptional regulator [Bacteroidales bacterium]